MAIQDPAVKTFDEHRLPAFARVEFSGGEAFEATILDLSMKGVFLDCPAMASVGSRCQATIYFGRHDHEFLVVASCIVVRADVHTLALRFESVALNGSGRFDPFEQRDGPVSGGESEQLVFSRHGGWIFTP